MARRSRARCSTSCSAPMPATASAARRTYYDPASRLAHAVGVDRPRAVARRDRRHRPLPQRWCSRAFDAAGVPRPGQPHAATVERRGGDHRACTDSTGRAGADPDCTPDRGAARRARRARRARQRSRPTCAGYQPVARPAAAHRARTADDRDEPPPRVHRQPGHGQDHRRPPAEPDPAHPRRGVQGPSRGDRSRHLVAGYVGQTAGKTQRGARVGARRHAADRRGLRVGARRRPRLRARGHRHDRQVHGGPPRRSRRHRRRLPRRDARR